MKTLAMILLCLFASPGEEPAGNKNFDIEKYMGRWYEVARFDHWFERGLSHVKTTYTLEDDGKVRVENSGVRPDGKIKTVIGRAKMADDGNPMHLRVSFFLWFYSDYNILDIDPEYRYVLIGSSSDSYLWILSRTPSLPADVKERLLNTARENGYDTSRLIWVEQE
jgi:lipocalin